MEGLNLGCVTGSAGIVTEVAIVLLGECLQMHE
jgi:hypothetical protein